MKYQITVEFESSNLLNEREGTELVRDVLAQIEDPRGITEHDKRARYTTTFSRCQLANEYFTTTFTPEGVTTTPIPEVGQASTDEGAA